MEEQVFGSFHFRLTDSGNLLGEYFNNHGNIILTESANLINTARQENARSIFAGEYITSWLEGNTPTANRIRIERIPNTNIFNIFWTTIGNRSETFRGKATLLNENIIYGYYSGEPFIREINE